MLGYWKLNFSRVLFGGFLILGVFVLGANFSSFFELLFAYFLFFNFFLI